MVRVREIFSISVSLTADKPNQNRFWLTFKHGKKQILWYLIYKFE